MPTDFEKPRNTNKTAPDPHNGIVGVRGSNPPLHQPFVSWISLGNRNLSRVEDPWPLIHVGIRFGF